MNLENLRVSSNALDTLDSLKLPENKKEPQKTEEPKTQTQLAVKDNATYSIPRGVVPKVAESVAANLSKPQDLSGQPLVIGNQTFTNVKKITTGIELEEAKKILKDNKIDEVIVKTEDGSLYVAYGAKENKGALDLANIKESYIGKLGNKTAKVVYIDNETNTVSEGAKSPIKSTWGSIKEATSSSVTKGITELGGTLVGMFIGKSLMQNGITAVQAANSATETVNAVGNGVKTLASVGKVAGRVEKTGFAIVGTITGGLRDVAVGAAIAGLAVGAVIVPVSVYTAVKARNPKNDYTTLDMVTNQNLAFKPDKPEVKIEDKK